MEQHETPITEKYLKSLEGIKDAEPKDFFYTRLKIRLAKEQKDWIFPLKPAWMIAALALFLLANTFILIEKSKSDKNAQTASIESFATAYDQNISSY